MRKTLIVNSVPEVSAQLERIIEEHVTDTIVAVRSNIDEALEFLHYELPEIIIINFSDESMDMFRAVDLINEDLWLINGGIIAVHSEPNEDKFLEKLTHSNVLSVMFLHHIEQRLPSTLQILSKNEHLIFQRDIPEQFTSGFRGTFTIDNDPFAVNVYANLISLYLYCANLITIEEKSFVKNALVELLLNAIEHGNCGITFDEKSEALGEGRSAFDIIQERLKDPAVARKRVTLSFRTSSQVSTFSIKDEGEGFDWRSVVEHALDEDRKRLSHGRGILMTAQGVQKLRYNEKGNVATFDVAHQANTTNLRPKIFQNKPEVHCAQGDIIFKKGEVSNFLSYVVSGRYNVLDDQGKKFATITPNDIFIGEMAFLMGNVRTATVQADSAGTMVNLTKQEFVEVIKNFPYYGLFLARLLAQRMVKLRQGVYSAEDRSVDDFIKDSQRQAREQNYKEACNQLKLADIIFPNDDRVVFLLGKYLAASGRFDEALEYVSRYSKLKPGDANAYVIKGFCLLRQDKLEEAKHACHMALDRDPENPDAYYNLVKVFVALNAHDEAESALGKLKRLMPAHPKIDKMTQALRSKA